MINYYYSHCSESRGGVSEDGEYRVEQADSATDLLLTDSSPSKSGTSKSTQVQAKISYLPNLNR